MVITVWQETPKHVLALTPEKSQLAQSQEKRRRSNTDSKADLLVSPLEPSVHFVIFLPHFYSFSMSCLIPTVTTIPGCTTADDKLTLSAWYNCSILLPIQTFLNFTTVVSISYLLYLLTYPAPLKTSLCVRAQGKSVHLLGNPENGTESPVCR